MKLNETEKTIELLPQNVVYYKANLHCHTTVSDGKLTPGEIKQAYMERGYQIVAFTDHNVYRNHSYLNDEKFIALAGMETDISDIPKEGCDYSCVPEYHLNWFDTDPGKRGGEKELLGKPMQRYHDMEALNLYIKEMNELGFLGCYNHPYWSLQTCEDYNGLKGLWAMEIYNHGCEMWGLYGYNPQAYDEMLRSGQRLFCVSTDDNHNLEKFSDNLCDSFGGYVMIGAEEFSYEGIMEALRKGRFYSCTAPDGRAEAPRIHQLALKGNRLLVRCSPADKIFVKLKGRDGYRASAAHGGIITEAEFTLTGKEEYFHVDIYDGQGRHTNTNVYYLEDFKSSAI